MKKIGVFRRAILLTKSAWQVLRLQKNLLYIKLTSIVTVLSLYLSYFLVYALVNGRRNGDSYDFELFTNKLSIILFISVGLVATLVSTLFSGIFVHAALDKIRGNSVSIRRSISAVKKKKKSLIVFSLFSSTIGLIISFLKEKLPFGGAIFSAAANFSWAVASFFSIQVIMDSKKELMPVDVIRNSSNLMKKKWSDSVVINTGVSMLFLLVFIAYFSFISSVAISGLVLANNIFEDYQSQRAILVSFSLVQAMLYLFAITLFATLSHIVKTTIYEYAKTGALPEGFDREVLESSISIKKAKKIFG
jgi:cytochrome b subunit of formate dehydrogenase